MQERYWLYRFVTLHLRQHGMQRFPIVEYSHDKLGTACMRSYGPCTSHETLPTPLTTLFERVEDGAMGPHRASSNIDARQSRVGGNSELCRTDVPQSWKEVGRWLCH